MLFCWRSHVMKLITFFVKVHVLEWKWAFDFYFSRMTAIRFRNIDTLIRWFITITCLSHQVSVDRVPIKWWLTKIHNDSYKQLFYKKKKKTYQIKNKVYLCPPGCGVFLPQHATSRDRVPPDRHSQQSEQLHGSCRLLLCNKQLPGTWMLFTSNHLSSCAGDLIRPTGHNLFTHRPHLSVDLFIHSLNNLPLPQATVRNIFRRAEKEQTSGDIISMQHSSKASGGPATAVTNNVIMMTKIPNSLQADNPLKKRTMWILWQITRDEEDRRLPGCQSRPSRRTWRHCQWELQFKDIFRISVFCLYFGGYFTEANVNHHFILLTF